MTAPLRVGYLSDSDPQDRWAWSGGHHYMFRALQGQGLAVTHIGRTLLRKQSITGRLARTFGFVRSASAQTTDEMHAARVTAVALQAELAENPCDVLFAPVASKLLALLDTEIPSVYMSDATVRLLRRGYAEAASLPADVLGQREELEALAIRRSSAVVYPSRWAADSAVYDYQAAPERVRVIPLGANLDDIPSADALAGKGRDFICRLLFIGRDWERKGGNVALQTLEALRQQGMRAELTICGSTPPAGAGREGVTVFTNLDKRKTRDRRTLHDLLMRSHFLLFPSRAECFGMVVGEANAYGVPVVSTDVGGIPVEEGKNGFRLPLEAHGREYARVIASAYRDDVTYRNHAAAARRMFDERLNWTAWGRSMRAELGAAVGRAKGTREAA